MIVLAFNIVSAVVNVLEHIIIRVSSALRCSVALLKSIGSTFAKNLIVLPSDAFLQSGCDLKASCTNSMPK